MNNNNFKGLSNEELVVIHDRFTDHLNAMDKMLKEKSFLKNIQLGKSEGAVVKVPLEDDEVQKIRQSEYYQITKQVVDRLSPIVALIQDTAPVRVPNINSL
jgi:hypothetical protein